jgi:ABC-type branched-subunit amino acid transport system substrate-binding protein
MSRPRVVATPIRAILALCLVAAGAAASSSTASSRAPIRIGVMLPLTGPNAEQYATPLAWAAANVNRAGGIRGRRLVLVYRDTGRQSLASAAEAFARDRSITAVVGPDSTNGVYETAPLFFDAGKVFVSPSATSADLDRSLVGDGPSVFWRTIQSDVAQTRVLLDAAVSGGARSLALVATSDDYGTTFFDWFGFLANELGVEVTYTGRFDPTAATCVASMDAALATHPQALIATPASAQSAVCMAREWRRLGKGTRLFFSDSGIVPSAAAALRRLDPALTGTGPAPDPAGGFAAAYARRFGSAPPPYAANAYDAVLLLAIGLEAANGRGGAPLRAALARLTAPHARHSIGWQSLPAAFAAIRSGHSPTVEGAAGPLTDTGVPPTPVSTAYELWKLGPHGYAPTAFYTSRPERGAIDAQRVFARLAHGAPGAPDVGTGYVPASRTGLWALLVATSDGWPNYRHQADVMAQYAVLRGRGVAANHIVVVMANDLAAATQNPHPGDVAYVAGGPNLDAGIQVDYPIAGMTAASLMAILTGQSSPSLPYVLHSGPGDDVLVYVAGHGDVNGIYLGLDNPVLEPGVSYSVLTPTLLGQTIEQMSAAHAYRRLLVVLEACQSGTFASSVVAPGALLAASAAASEDSLSANYSPKFGTWLADQFSYALYEQELAAPDQSLAALFENTLYDEVTGSHVTLSGPHFGTPLLDVKLSEFISP